MITLGRGLMSLLVVAIAAMCAAVPAEAPHGGGCNPFVLTFTVDSWPVTEDAYNVVTEVRSIDGGTHQCRITEIRPNGDLVTLPVNPDEYFEIGPEPVTFAYHIALPCHLLAERSATAGIIIDWGGSCLAFGHYSFATTPTDFNCDGVVDAHDLMVIIEAWGYCPVWPQCEGNLTADDHINVEDLLKLLSKWGPTQ